MNIEPLKTVKHYLHMEYQINEEIHHLTMANTTHWFVLGVQWPVVGPHRCNNILAGVLVSNASFPWSGPAMRTCQRCLSVTWETKCSIKKMTQIHVACNKAWLFKSTLCIHSLSYCWLKKRLRVLLYKSEIREINYWQHANVISLSVRFCTLFWSVCL